MLNWRQLETMNNYVVACLVIEVAEIIEVIIQLH